MSVQQVLGDLPKSEFLEQFYLQQPLARQGTAAELVPLGDWEVFERALADAASDVLVAREGRLWDGANRPTYAQARRLHEEGYTLVLRNAQRHDERLAALAEGFARDFAAEVNIHLYCTPPQQYGFGWHYDAEDVFIVQTAGNKEYLLRKNTVNPWPTVETLPADMQFERELMPVMRCELAAGDWLYIPAGYWHRAQAAEAARSLAIGVLPPTGIEVLDRLRRDLLGSLLWRQRLPIVGAAQPRDRGELQRMYGEIFAALAEDVRRRLEDPRLVEEFLAGRVADRQERPPA